MLRKIQLLFLIVAIVWTGWNFLILAAEQLDTAPVDEFFAVRKTFDAINWNGEPAKTSGWDNVTGAEWPLFSLTYWSYAGCNLAKANPARQKEILQEVDWGIDHILTRRIMGFIEPHFGDPLAENLQHPSALVHGHLLYLLMLRRDVDQNPARDALIHRLAKSFSEAYAKTPSGILPSYPTLYWPTDNLPAQAGLRLYDKAFGTKLADEPCRHWVESMKAHYLNKSTGLISAYINPVEKIPSSGPRGVALMFSFPFLKEVDPDFAREQFGLTKKYLVGQALGMTAVREFPEGQSGRADVDSGELIMGFGPAASGFGIGSAAAMDDRSLREALLQSKSLAVATAKSTGQDKELLPPVGRSVILFGESYPMP